MSLTPKQAKRQRQREARKRRKAERQRPVIRGNRVLLRAPPRPYEGSPASDDAWEQKCERECRRVVHPVVRLTDEGPDWGVVPRPGDLIGFAMHPYRHDGCFEAAIATATQISIEQVPELDLDHRLEEGEDPEDISRTSWERIESWAASHSLVIRIWQETHVPRDRWIAVSVGTEENSEIGEGVEFGDHCLVMHRDRIIFDPSCSLVPPPGMEMRKHTLSSVTYGLSFDKEK